MTLTTLMNVMTWKRSAVATMIAIAAGTLAVATETSSPVEAAVATVDIVGPAGSGRFGEFVVVLPNGNFVVEDSEWDSPTAVDVGAVSLFDGRTNELISTLTGSNPNDRVGITGIQIVGGSNFVVKSPLWRNGGAEQAGAATWVNGQTGLSGLVSPANSLVGSSDFDQVGVNVVQLTNGNYVVAASGWDNGALADAGAATWSRGTAGITGTISAANSLIGTSADDIVGDRTVALTNGHYVVYSVVWDSLSPAVADVGAATWGNGLAGTKGVVTSGNSLVGTKGFDLNAGSIVPLANGNYVVASPGWDRGVTEDAGAVTWRPGTGPFGGSITSSTSLVGSHANDAVGRVAVALSNGNYAVGSSNWDNGLVIDAGAATWGNGDTGTVGPVSTANSLVGTTAGNAVGLRIAALTNGNYVVGSPLWDDGGTLDVGAVTWRPGSGASPATVGRANSLFGTTAVDEIGFRLVALTNGNYVVNSDTWDDGTTTNVGSVTWGNGSTGTSGAVTAANSLVGSNRNDLFDSITVPLANGNYVVASPSWTFGSNSKAGAATWRPGNGPASGLVSPGNSLVGTNSDDGESLLVKALPNGDYVIDLPGWDRGATLDAGAVTFGSGASGGSGPISAASSLVGRSAGDRLGLRISVFPDGRYASFSERWDALPEADSGVVVVAPSTGLSGEVDAGNSLQGHSVNGGTGLNVANRYTSAGSIVVGRPAENRVSIVVPAPVPPSGTGASGFVALSPARVFDTRPSEPQGLVAVVKQKYGGGSVLKVRVAGTAGVPVAGVGAVSLNVTAVGADAPGFVTVYPCGDRPLASSLNYVTGQIVPNAVIAPLSPQGEICLFSSAGTHLIADLNGWFASGPGFAALSPVRVFDTRPSEPQGAVEIVKQKYGGGNVLRVRLAGSAGVPVAGVGAVSLNVTAVGSDAPGFVTVFPCGDRPLASSVNYVAGQIVPNAVIAPLSAEGEVCLFSSADTHLIADVNGWFASGSAFTALSPLRVFDTRPSDPQGAAEVVKQKYGGGTILEVRVTGTAGVPVVGVGAVSLNVTAVSPDGPGFVTVFPCGDRPLASSLNYVAGQIVPNAVIAPVSGEGEVCLFSSADTHLIADVNGWFAG